MEQRPGTTVMVSLRRQTEMASFQGLRLAFTSIDSNNHYICLLLANGVEDVLDISQAPNTDQEAFLAWWVTENERAARDEKKILVVCNSY